jgi:hypothetical protein
VAAAEDCCDGGVVVAAADEDAAAGAGEATAEDDEAAAAFKFVSAFAFRALPLSRERMRDAAAASLGVLLDDSDGEDGTALVAGVAGVEAAAREEEKAVGLGSAEALRPREAIPAECTSLSPSSSSSSSLSVQGAKVDRGTEEEAATCAMGEGGCC